MAPERTYPDGGRPGPFRADQLREGDRYELSRGHPIWCAPQGDRGSQANLAGGAVVDSDPDVDAAGVDPGFSPEPGTLRAPDVAVGNLTGSPGWAKGVPLLALEYADTGQDEPSLALKIEELLAAGTKVVWVARLVGPRRVEIHEAGQPMRVVRSGGELTAPGILRNPVPVDALFDRQAAHAVVLRNLLQRRGYASLEAVQVEAKVKAKAEALLAVCAARGLAPTDAERARVLACTDLPTLERWLTQAARAASIDEALA